MMISGSARQMRMHWWMGKLTCMQLGERFQLRMWEGWDGSRLEELGAKVGGEGAASRGEEW